MKKLLFTFFLLPFLCSAHPIKMSLLYINYDADAKSVYMECRLFSDDLSFAIQQELAPPFPLNYGHLTEKQKYTVNEFINKHINVSFGDKKLRLEYYDYEYNSNTNVLTFKYDFPSISLIKGQKIFMSNSLFFKQFKFAQTNVFEVDIPKVAQSTIQCYYDDYAKTFTVK